MDRGRIASLNPILVIGLIMNTMVGVNLLGLAHSASKLGYNLWWSPILLGSIVSLTLIPMMALCRRYPEDNLFRIHEKLLGKWLGRCFNVLIILYAILSVSTANEGYVRLVQTSMLNNQTVTLPLIGLTLVMVYITNGGIKLIARFCLLTFFFTGWMVFLLQYGFQKGGITHIFPLINTDWRSIAETIHNSSASMLGYELVLFFYPYIQEKNKAHKHVLIGVWSVVLLYVLILITSVSYFSEWQMDNLIYPVLNLFKAVELSFLERIENLGIGLWVFLILSTSTGYLWVARTGLEEMAGKTKLWHLLLPTIISFLFIVGPLSVEKQRYIYDKVSVYMAYGLILWPIFLLMIHSLRFGRGERVS
ncbi:GerAB/ArcD/ProY family transporter [Brevibacillus sp. HB2.2]|uniref:GerAB/ArcD/ProY family transporter n=1 Tax=Brevibacillus sp. HB2.2 TaxID=2738846 RepID=UPI00156B1D02|nr:GerAB/ArcD/ProY family transporter [Brevibacillus sp. HB2.2]NRS48195.1 GerAB/ArcD/ProY family transporter [Brevibacillus sp. HB2.2]